MPTIAERTGRVSDFDPGYVPAYLNDTAANNPGPLESENFYNSLSPVGNPAPNRGIIPIDTMYDFNTHRFNPSSPYFVRGFVDVNTFIRNTALQALSGTTKVN